MEDSFGDWRRRFSVHAALLLLFGVGVGFMYFQRLTYDDPPCAPAPHEQRWCQPWHEPVCAADHQCKIDTVAEDRFRAAHLQAMLHALLLLGFGFAAPHLRVPRPIFSTAGWLLIVGCWAAPISAALQAFTLYSTNQRLGDLITGIGVVAGITTSVGLALVALRSAWEALRDGIAPPTWRNWALIVKARPRRIAEPRNLEALLAAVQEAMDLRMGVRAFGGRYSWSAIAPTNGTMIDMRRLRGIEAPANPDPNDTRKSPNTTQVVTVQAGAMIREITEALAKDGLMLATTTVLPWAQIGGALALGCHGTGIHQKPLTDLVTALEIVQYAVVDGRKMAKSVLYRRPLQAPDNSNAGDWSRWNALLVNLGCLGVMYRITLECVPIYDVRLYDERKLMEDTLKSDAELKSIITREFSEIFWFPYNRECFVRTWGKITNQPVEGFPLWFWWKQWAVAKFFGPVAFLLLGVFPFLTPAATRLFHRLFGNLDFRVRAPDAMQYERYFLRVFDMGYAIPIDPYAPGGFDRFREAWFDVVDRLEAAHHQALYPQNLVMHVRFGQNSSAHLAPNSSGTHSAYIEIIAHANTAGHEQHFAAVERTWLRLGGKAHWAKLTYDRARMLENYSPAAVQAFLAVRRAMDPDQVFLNDYVRDVLHVEEP